MYLEINGITYRVRFSYLGELTFAKLFRLNNQGILFDTSLEGVAILGKNDTFEKSKGRKVALADLLEKLVKVLPTVANYEFTKQDRAKIWEEYFRTHKK